MSIPGYYRQEELERKKKNLWTKKKRGKPKFAPFKSALELAVSKKLPKRRWEYEPERIEYMLPKKYIPDFVIQSKSGKKIYIEVKGWFRWEDQQKMRAVKNSRPDMDIRMFFPKDQKVQTSEMLNSEWCHKHDFKCAIGAIPRSWWNE